jgi:hypothetical protein
MPIYQYRKVGTSQVVELLRTVAQRDSVPPGLIRITVPARVALFGTSSDARDEHSADYQVPRAYRQLEEKVGTSGVTKESVFSPSEVREAWGF